MYDMTQKMKGGFHSIRSKQISLVLIVLVCITILILGCQRTSLLFPFLLQVDQVSRVSEDVLIDGSEPRPVLPTYSIQVSDGEEIELDKTNNSDEQDQQNHLEETSLVTEEIPANDIEIGHKPRLALEEDNMASGDTFSYNNKTEDGQHVTSEEGKKDEVDQNRVNTNSTSDLETALPSQVSNKSIVTPNEKQDNMASGDTFFYNNKTEDGQHVTSEEGKKDEVDQNRVNTNSTSDLETALPSQVSNKSIVTPNEKQDNMASGDTFFYNNKTEDGQPVTSEEGNKDEVDQNLVNTNSTSDLETALPSQVSNKSIVTPNEKQDNMASGDTFSYNNKTEDGQPVTSEEGNKDEVDQNRVNTNSTSDLETALPSHVSNKSIVTPNEKQVCNYGKGKWVSDESRPLYSGFKCKRWLSPMWACRLTQRKDFAYEKLRWKPKDCDVEDFQGDKFLERMRNKTLAFVGDSLGRQQFQSIMCMITGGKDRLDVRDIGNQFGLVRARGSVRPDGWAYLFPSTNTTILYYWSASLCDLTPIDPSNPKTKVAMHLDRPPAFLQHFLHRIDVLVLNTGHHWNRGKLNANRWVMYVGGKPNTNKRIAMIAVAKNFTIHSIVQWVDWQLPKYPGLKAFFRTISPRHFFNGDWNSGGSCDNTSPMSEGKEILQDKSSDSIASSAVMGKRVKLLDITAVSQLRDEGHISRYSIKATPGVQDCLHWCLPGVPDAWNEILNAQI